MSEPLPHRSASGARQGGDDYQHLVAWNRILRGLMSGRRMELVELEALEAPTSMTSSSTTPTSRTSSPRFAMP
jgi:hypothetical protein